jgi:hypothetical protein
MASRRGRRRPRQTGFRRAMAVRPDAREAGNDANARVPSSSRSRTSLITVKGRNLFLALSVQDSPKPSDDVEYGLRRHTPAGSETTQTLGPRSGMKTGGSAASSISADSNFTDAVKATKSCRSRRRAITEAHPALRSFRSFPDPGLASTVSGHDRGSPNSSIVQMNPESTRRGTGRQTP